MEGLPMPRGPTTAAAPRRIVFSSGQLPATLSDHRRRTLWRDVYSELYGPLDVRYAEERPFSARLECTPLGSLGLVRCRSTVERFVRTRRCVAVAGSDSFHLLLNAGSAPMAVRQMNREAWIEPGAAALLTDPEPGEFVAGPDNRWLFVTVPRRLVLERVAGADDLASMPLDGGQPALRHLRRYLAILLAPDGIDGDASLNAIAETTLMDLMALVLGARRDSAELARVRGLRAARLQTIVAAIGTGYDDPHFSVQAVASQVGLSPRYVQDLLRETARTLTERVLERRLQKARAMLADRRFGGRPIIDIALAAGFSEVSYFNRAFRRRFGVSPSGVRQSACGS